MKVTWPESGAFRIQEVAAIAGVDSARRGAEMETIPSQFLQSERVSVEKTLEITFAPGEELRRGGPLPIVAIDVALDGDESALVVLRHPSGAITFHAPGAARRGETAGGTLEFRIPVRQALTENGRRGIITQAIKAVVLKVTKPIVDKAVDFVLPKLAALWEEQSWKKRGLSEGWFRVSAGTGGISLAQGVPGSQDRNLLLIHGTFSDAAGAFGALSKQGFFSRIQGIYGDRIYAFNHFTVSRSPQENVQALLSALPDKRQTFDVITHSRGGLVLRTIVERASDFGTIAQRFQLGHAVLVASPNDGTPLASPQRWEETVGWIANLLEIVNQFGENPFTTAAEWVSEAIVWLAHHVAGDLPGLRAMDMQGETIQDLQAPPPPPAHAYAALVANFEPEGNLVERLADAGKDQFFSGANDLVVPTEGGWRVDRDGQQHVDPDQIGCFGKGGNLAQPQTSTVMHTNFFGRTETAAFLENALSGKAQNLPQVDPGVPLPDHRFLRSAAGGAPDGGAAAPAEIGEGPQETGGQFKLPSTAAPDTFHIVILKGAVAENSSADGKTREPALIFAAYGGARVVEPFYLSGGDAGGQWKRIIDIHEQIKDYTDRQKGALPDDKTMNEFGELLFHTLFPGNVKRLYDTARSLQQQRRRMLDLVFTSMVPWVAEKPWEFALDPTRESYLATEEIHFIRNVLTAIPGDNIDPFSGPLRILVASALPVGFGRLSIDEETAVIRRGFDALVDSGLVEVEVLPRATVHKLHGCLLTGGFHAVHFIGHGSFDPKQGGFLMFQDERGGAYPLGQRSARELFCNRGLQLVFLNACQTASAVPSDYNKGMAQALVAHGLPALVANQYSVMDVSATSFAQFFYWALAHGMTLGEAAREARISVNYSLGGDPIDWAVPVLYARDPNTRLAEKVQPLAMPPLATLTQSRRDAISQHDLRIAVWDVDHVLPELPATLEILNRAQTRFGFEVVDLSVPLDAFDYDSDPSLGRYLRVDRLANRLQSKTVELHINYLMCVTSEKLKDEKNNTGFYLWWPDGRKPPVLIMSYAAFPELKPSGMDTNRALVNAIVTSLAGIQANVGTHEDGSLLCPLHGGTQTSYNTLIAEQSFDEQCKQKLQNFPPDLEALQVLLRVFDVPKPGG
jgi:hypothetical protein